MPAVFPVAYFGSVSYYKSLVQAGEISFELFEHYVKQTLRNRMAILSPNGVQNLSIPVIKPQGNKTITKNMLISDAENWQKVHWRAIESAYAASPYFEHYGSEVKQLIEFDSENLVDFNLNIHSRIVQWLDLPIQTRFTDTYSTELQNGQDFRNAFRELDLQADYHYTQVFSPEGKFVADLSILDAIFNLGPMARKLFVEK